MQDHHAYLRELHVKNWSTAIRTQSYFGVVSESDMKYSLSLWMGVCDCA